MDPRQPRVRKFLPPAPQWLVPTQPRRAPDYSHKYGEVDLRWAQNQPYCRDGFFIPNLARTSSDEWKNGRRMPRVIPMGIPEGMEFKEVRPQVKPDIRGGVPHEVQTTGMGGVYGSRSQWVDPTSEGVIQEMATVLRWDGDPSTLDDWEEQYNRWREGYGRRFDEREQMDLLLCAIKNEQTQELHAKNRHRQRFTFKELYQDISGRKIRNVHEPGARFRRRHIPAQPLVAVTWADFMSDWSEEGAEVTDGMTNRQATDALVILLQQHCAECPEDGCARRAYQKIWDQQSENANEYHYLEVYLLVMRMLLQEEYAKTS